MEETKSKIIYADFRENRCRVPALLAQAGFNVRQANLAADYSLGPNYLVERKTVADAELLCLRGFEKHRLKTFRELFPLAQPPQQAITFSKTAKTQV